MERRHLPRFSSVRILVTGAGGFVGGHLLRHLEKSPHEAIAGVRTEAERINEKSLVIDVSDRESVVRAIEQSKPDAIVNLAGQPSIPISWDDPLGTFSSNLLGAANLLEKLVGNPEVRLLLVGSAHLYAPKPGNAPLVESDPLSPASPYAVSKAAQEMLARVYHSEQGVNVLVTRSFNHAGPGQGSGFAIGDFCMQIVKIERGEQEPVIRVGRLETRRDLLDVRDVVSAYTLLVERGIAGEAYNVSSGKSVAIRELLDLLLAVAGVRGKVEIDEDASPRAGDPEVLIGDNSKIREAVGWSPKISIEQTLADTLSAYRAL